MVETCTRTPSLPPTCYQTFIPRAVQSCNNSFELTLTPASPRANTESKLCLKPKGPVMWLAQVVGREGWGNLSLVFVLLSHQNAKLMAGGKLGIPMPQMVSLSTVPVRFLDELGFQVVLRHYFYTKSG